MENLSDQFLSSVYRLQNTDMPSSANLLARACILDFIGCSLAGACVYGNRLAAFCQEYSEIGTSSLIGRHGRMVSLPISAMLNAVSAHAIELDDGHRIGMLHLGAPIISSLLAVAEKEDVSAVDFIRGVIIGYEVAIRLACCVQPGCKLRGYHATGTCGTVGAAMGIATALHFDKEQMKSAFSAAMTSAAGLLEMIEGDSEMKPFNAGHAAMDGVTAAYIGKARFKAPGDALGGKRGFLNAMTDNPKLEYLTDFSSGKYMIEGIYMKPYAACRHCHPAIEAALHIRKKNGFNLDEVESIQVDTYKLAVGGHDHIKIDGINSAKMSIPYSLAVALSTGKAGLDEYTDSYITDSRIQFITDKVSVNAIDELTELCPQKRVAVVTVRTTKGDYKERVDYPKGEPENPLTHQELEDKFRELAIYGGLTPEECDKVIKELWKESFNLDTIMGIVCK